MSTNQTDQASTDLDTLRAVTAAAMGIFAAPPGQHAARAYLRQRGVDPTGLDPPWQVGYAPPGWTRLVDKLREQFDEQALLEAGVARRSSRGPLIDTFRDRVIFGIHNAAGQLAGFIGRDLSGDPNAPKYLNTPRHVLFDKGSLLFGLHEGIAGSHARQPVVVEGPLDVLAIASRAQRDGGDLVPLAACGTAFTAAHARQVAKVAFRHESAVVVAMDGDTAGRLAALAAGEQLRKVGLDARVAMLANGSDPAEYLTRVGASLDTFRVDHGLPLLTVRVQQITAMQGDRMQWIEGRLAALRSIADYVATYPSSYAAKQVGWLADDLSLSASTVTIEFAEAYRRADAGRFSMPRLHDMAPRGFNGRSPSIEA